MVGRHGGRTPARRLAAVVLALGVLGSVGAGVSSAADGTGEPGPPLWSADPAAGRCDATSVGVEVRRCRFVSVDARTVLAGFVSQKTLAQARDWPVVTAVWSTADQRLIPGSQIEPGAAVPVPATVNLALFDGTVVPVRTGMITTQRRSGQTEVHWFGGVWRGGQQVSVTQLRLVVRGSQVRADAEIAVDGRHYRLVPLGTGSAYRLDELDPQIWAGEPVSAGSMSGGPSGSDTGTGDRQVIRVTVPGSNPSTKPVGNPDHGPGHDPLVADPDVPDPDDLESGGSHAPAVRLPDLPGDRAGTHSDDGRQRGENGVDRVRPGRRWCRPDHHRAPQAKAVRAALATALTTALTTATSTESAQHVGDRARRVAWATPVRHRDRHGSLRHHAPSRRLRSFDEHGVLPGRGVDLTQSRAVGSGVTSPR